MATLNRDELYNQVWKEPMTKLALKYNISDVGLRKICIVMGIPTPRAGYWAKIQAGKKTQQIPLPHFDSQLHVQTYTISFQKKETGTDSPDDKILEILKPLGTIAVPEKVKTLHPLVVEAKEFLSEMTQDNYGVIGGYRRSLHVRVSKNQLERAFRIFDTICKGFDRINLKIENEREKRGTFVSIHGEHVHFLIEERIRQVDHILTPDEKNRKRQYPYFSAQKFDYHPTGELSIRIDEYCDGCRKKWRDGDKKLEDQLGDFFTGVFIAAASLKKRTLEREAESRRWREEQERKEAEQQRKIEEQLRYKALEENADKLLRAHKIRDYVAYTKRLISQGTTTPEELQKLSEWEKWALEYAQTLEKMPNILQ